MRRAAALFAIAFALSFAALTPLTPGEARAGDDFVKVIPPGNEKLVSEMLGHDPKPFPDQCTLSGASIERTKIVATYACAGKPVTIALHHPADPAASGAAAKTAEFAIVVKGDAPRAFLAEIEARLKDKERAWRWVSAEAPGLGVAAGAPDGPSAPTAPGKALTPEQSDAFIAGVKLYRAGQMQEAFERFRKLAETAPENGVLGMVVASLASTSPTQDKVDVYAAEADAKPSDTLAQFVAGVAAHYCGHRNAKTRDEKKALYERAIKYLSRARPKYDFEPRVFVYLAVSHFRLGHQKEAEELIEAAIPLAQNDPDVYYCRGEIFQRVNVARSIADIRKYLDMSDALGKQGVPRNEGKHERVKQMLAHLEAVQRGAAQPEDLFDPLPETKPARTAPPPPHRAFTSSSTFGGVALAIAALSTLVWMVRRNRAKGS